MVVKAARERILVIVFMLRRMFTWSGNKDRENVILCLYLTSSNDYIMMTRRLVSALILLSLGMGSMFAEDTPKKVYMSFILHGNMNYDRYVRTTIWEQFPVIYDNLLDFMDEHPDFKGQVQFSGQTAGSLKITAPEVLSHALELQKKGQLNFTGTFYSEPVNVNMDGETNYRCAWLGTKIIESIAGMTDGFYLQERAYHPQLPWILKESDVSWVPVIAGDDIFRPFRLKGLDGSSFVCVPTTRERLAEKITRAPENSLIVIEEDYEIPQHFSGTYSSIARFNAEHPDIQVEWITVKDYIEKFGLGEEQFVDHSVKARNPENGTYSRWTADPLDIQVQEATNSAMADFRAAKMMNALMQEYFGETLDVPFDKAGIVLERDPITWNIEHTDLYPDVESRFLSRGGEVTVLSKAEHLLLWAVNSDAKGWDPLYERRRERIWSLKTCSSLSKLLIDKGLDYLSTRMRLRGFDRYYLVASFEQERTATIRFEEDFPCRYFDLSSGKELVSSSRFADGKTCHEVDLPLPAFGYKAVGVKREDRAGGTGWSEGDSIEQDGIRISSDGDKVIIEREGKRMELGLSPFMIRVLAEVTQGTNDDIWRPNRPYGPVRTGVRLTEGAAQLRLLSQPDWQVHLEQVFSIRRGEIVCDLKFTFPNPCLVRQEGAFEGRKYLPGGLDLVLRTFNKGKPYFDIPFGISEGLDGVSYLCPLSTCFLQQEGGGIIVSPQTGEQAFRVDAEAGEVTVYLGSSTTSGPIHDVGLAFDTPTSVRHEPAWYSEPFHGEYRHRVVIRPFDGDWETEHVPLIFRNFSSPVYVRAVQPVRKRAGKELPPENSFISINSPDVDITMMDYEPGKGLTFRLNERTGQELSVTVEINKKKTDASVMPFGIVLICPFS